MHDAIVIALGSPVHVGVYDENGRLTESIHSDGLGSDVLALIFDDLLKKYRFNHLIYANGPGSFMGIKVAYLFLKTLCIVRNIPLLAVDGFFFNANHPIKAVGKLYFVKNSNTITMEPLENPTLKGFELPQTIDVKNFNTDSAPYYGIEAVG
ncbi:MAG: hypothetical protein Q8K81_00205 [Sulfuricurvum sp.]|nr:hypothetical protein [Sulfuricurvum sp.]